MNNEELERAYKIIEYTGTNLFLTGKAGTGKTTFLKNLKKKSPKRMVVTAPTGIAAINAGGVTIHSFFQLPFAPYIPGTKFNFSHSRFRFGKEKRNIIRTMDLLIIDEISMVRADLLDSIDSVLRRYRNDSLPFGGVQLLMIGDLQQLAPVVKDEERQMLSKYYETAFFFSSHALKKTNYATIELKQVYRQTDPVFLSLLNKVRENQTDEQTLSALNKRYIPDFNPSKEQGYIRLVTHNAQALQINELEMSKLEGPMYEFNATITGNYPEYSYPTEKTLLLKKGAQIMFVKNDPSFDKLYYNGMIGEITEIDELGFFVRPQGSDQEIEVNPEEWENTKYELDEESKEITEKVEGVFKQYPVKMAWAITIHKSQGLTFEHAIIDAHASFAHGQAYVALSRCKTLEGMVLSTKFSQKAIINNESVNAYTNELEKRVPDDKSLEQMNRKYNFQVVSELFDFLPIKKLLKKEVYLVQEYFSQQFPQQLELYKQYLEEFETNILQVSTKFQKQFEQQINTLEDFKENVSLQERFKKGAEYFGKTLTPFKEYLEQINLPADNKEFHKKSNDLLNELNTLIVQKIMALEFIEQNGFELNQFLHQRALILLKEPKFNVKEKKEKKQLFIPTDILHPQLFEQLVEWRKEKAKELQVPAYVVLQQKAVIGITNLLPDNDELLLAIPHVGKKTLEKYGDELLEIVSQYVDNYKNKRE